MKEFRLNIVLRVLMITALALMLVYIITNKTWFFTPMVLAMLLLLSTWSLIYYIEKTNKDLTYFILSIKQGGFTTSFPPGKRGETFRKLSEAFNDVIEEFRKINLQKETHYQYLKTLTENIQAGILSFDNTGKIEMANPAVLQLLGVFRLSNLSDIKKISAKLYEAIHELKAGQRQLLRAVIAERELRLSIQLKELVVSEVSYKIVLMQDINQELEEQEVDAWQKLIRVLTHEIMNSVTPIVSLTEAVNTMLVNTNGERKELEKLDAEDKEDLFGSLQTIEKRSKGLLRFVNAYKDFTKIPELTIVQVDVAVLLRQVLSLLRPEFEKRQIDFTKIEIESNLIAHADAAWLEQVFINVFRNAMDALENVNHAAIRISASQKNLKIIVIISDNGAGMNKETLEKIFIPFFTTKKNGTGIGLSLSRQIMKLHKGSLNVASEPNKGTIVQLEW